jgi:GTP-binding protein HflX
VSARTGEGVPALLDAVAAARRAGARVVELEVPPERGDVLAAVHREGQVLVEVHGPTATRLRTRLPADVLGRFEEFVVPPPVAAPARGDAQRARGVAG